MASSSGNDTIGPRKSGPGNKDKSASDTTEEPENGDQHQGIGDAVGADLPAPDPHDTVVDEELLEMLEQLSDTIDTAQSVLSEQHLLAEATESIATAHPEVAPPPESADPARKDHAAARIAGAATIFIGAGLLGAYWLDRGPAGGPFSFRQANNGPRVSETVVTRKPVEERQETAAAEPQPVESPVADPAVDGKPATILAEPEKPAPYAMTPERQPAEPPAVDPGATRKPAETATAPRVVPPIPLEKEEEARLLDKGRTLASSGDIASARLAYEYAARRGSVGAMFALAQTYDPAVLEGLKVIGIRSDIRIALEWYSQAARLGHDAADARASELEQQIKR